MSNQAVLPNNTLTSYGFGWNEISVLEVISRFAPRNWKEKRGSVRGRYSMQCPLPDHDDRQRSDYSGSFSVDDSETVFKCFGCGAGGNAYQLQQILSGDAVGGSQPYRPPQPKKTKAKVPYKKLQGVTIDQLAQAKGFKPDFLRSLNWQDAVYGRDNTSSIRIPYPDENGADEQIRYRVGLDKGEHRFFWEDGAKPRPLGLNRLTYLREQDYVVYVEGETDYATGTVHGYPFQGIPGATNWQPEWAKHYQSLSTHYIWKEPGRGGEAFVARLTESFPNLRVIEAPPGAKDPTELAFQTGPDGFTGFFDELLDEADQAQVVADKVSDKKTSYLKCDKPKDRGERTSLWAEAKEIFPAPSHVKPQMQGCLLWSERDRKGLAVDRISNTWRNPANAAYKRRLLFFNILPRINGPQIYQRRVPVDDWNPTIHSTIKRSLQRAVSDGQGWMWVNKGLARGYFLYLTDALGLKGFEPVDDVRPVLIDALKSIRPPERDDGGGRFRPYGGSSNWVSKTEGTGERDMGRWEIIAVAQQPTDFNLIEAECEEAGVDTEFQCPYWRGQIYQGLAMRHSSKESFVAFAALFPEQYTLTKAALASHEVARK